MEVQHPPAVGLLAFSPDADADPGPVLAADLPGLLAGDPAGLRPAPLVVPLPAPRPQEVVVAQVSDVFSQCRSEEGWDRLDRVLAVLREQPRHADGSQPGAEIALADRGALLGA